MLQFPQSPALHDLWPDPGVEGVTQWQWDGVKWIARGLGAGASVIFGSPTAPTVPDPNMLWWNTTNGRLYIWYLAAWVEVTSVGPRGVAGINGPPGAAGARGATGATGPQGPPIGVIDGGVF